MVNEKKVIAVLPAYNAEKTLRLTLNDIPRDCVDEIILVDDASTDGTAALSRTLGLRTIVHDHNRGYGGNQKTCYAAALEQGADIVIMVHPDHQYDPTLVPAMVRPIANGSCDAVFGSRMLTRGGAVAGGMPRWKYAANKALTMFENAVLQLNLSEYHSGFRAYSRAVLESVRFEKNSDNFVFDTEIIAQLKVRGFRIKEIPIPTRYFKDASSVGVIAGIVYGLGIMRVMAEYLLHRIGIISNDKFR
ncbi:MAG: glycosyltransferase family 2 protein [Patescibacteria group bacterium]